MKCSSCGFETNEQIKFWPLCGTAFVRDGDTTGVDQLNADVYIPESENYMPPSTNITTGYSQQGNVYSSNNRIDDYLVLNIVFLVLNSITLCLCCGGSLAIPQSLVLFGSLAVSIIGVVYSVKAGKMKKAGNLEEAIKASKTARYLFFAALILFIIKIVLVIVGFTLEVSAYGGFDAWWQNILNNIEQNKYNSNY